MTTSATPSAATARRLTTRWVAVLTAAALGLALGGCAAAGGAAPIEPDGAGTYPRTIEVPAGSDADATELHLDAEPQRIAAISYEAAETLAEIGLADRLVAVPEAMLDPALGGHVDELAEVPVVIPVQSKTDPELVLSAAPDLVVMGARHGLDDTLAPAFEAAGVPVLVLPNGWSDVAEITADIRLLGQVTGAEAAADALADRLDEGLRGEGAGDAPPRVLVLSNQAGRPFVTAGSAFPTELVRMAGARDASADIGISVTGPISAEQIVQAAPDGILLVDMNGSGRALFAELLANDAVAGLDAVAEGDVHLIGGRQVQALGLDATLDGLAELRGWIAGL